MKRIFSILLAVLLLGALCVPAMAEEGYYSALNGSGSESSPYQIRNADDWDVFTAAVADDPSHGKGTYFKLTGDIGSAVEDEDTFILPCVLNFYGTLDGNGKTFWYNCFTSLISNNFGEVKNLIARSGEEIIGFSGGAVCNSNNGVIDHCINYVPMKNGVMCGGICGNNFGLIVNCINYAPIQFSSGDAGGICEHNNGLVLNCINTAPISGSGICGTTANDAVERNVLCFNCGLPATGYGITDFGSEDFHVLVLKYCHFLSPIDGKQCIASNSPDNNNYLCATGGEASSIEGGLNHMNRTIDEYDNQTGHPLVKWVVGNDGLPAFAEPLEAASVFSDGNWWIVVVGLLVILADVALMVILRKKEKTV